MNAARLTPLMRNGRRSALRALAASHCVIAAAGRTGALSSIVGGPGSDSRQFAAIGRRAAVKPVLLSVTEQ